STHHYLTCRTVLVHTTARLQSSEHYQRNHNNAEQPVSPAIVIWQWRRIAASDQGVKSFCYETWCLFCGEQVLPVAMKLTHRFDELYSISDLHLGGISASRFSILGRNWPG